MTYIPTILEVEEDEKTVASVKDDLKQADKGIKEIIEANEKEKDASRND